MNKSAVTRLRRICRLMATPTRRTIQRRGQERQPDVGVPFLTTCGRRSIPTVCRTQTTMLETTRLPIEQRLHVARVLVQALLGRHFTVNNLVLGRRQRGRVLGGDGEGGETIDLGHG